MNWGSCKHSTGYDSQNILDKVREATLKVKSELPFMNGILSCLMKYSIPGRYWRPHVDRGTK